MPFSGRGAGPPVPSADDHRIAHRYKTFEPTTLRSDAGEARVHLINLSATGALVHMADPPELGAAVCIDLKGTAAEARVVWRDGARFGLAFRTRLTSVTIDLFLRT